MRLLHHTLVEEIQLFMLQLQQLVSRCRCFFWMVIEFEQQHRPKQSITRIGAQSSSVPISNQQAASPEVASESSAHANV